MIESIAFVPDGNRRYAAKTGIDYWDAYRQGFDKAEQVLDWCYDAGIKEVTLWGASTENVRNRPEDEMKILLGLYRQYLIKLLNSPKLHKRQINVQFVGKGEFLRRPELADVISKIKAATVTYDAHRFNVALAYGGREELVSAFKKYASENDVHDLDEAKLGRYMYVTKEPQLIVRTSGVKRLSGYLLWQSAYSELYFTDKLWPEFSYDDFQDALNYYDTAKRNFGH